MTDVPGPAGERAEPTESHRRVPRGAWWRPRNGLAAALVVMAVCWIAVSIGSPLTGRTTFESTTILSTFAPWRAAAPNGLRPTQYCDSDTIDAVQPGRKLVVGELKHGQLAQYDPYQVGGSSTVLSQDTGVFDPVTFVPFMTLPLRIAPAYDKVLELAVVLLGMVLWVRRLGMSTAAGIVGGFVFGLSGFMVTWTNWPQTAVACWIPMLFWSAERLAQNKTLSSALLFALPVASMILGGFPAVTGWSIYAVAVYLLVRLLSQPGRLRSLVGGGLVAVGGGALGVAITSFMLLPFVQDYTGRNFGYRQALGTAVLTRQAAATALFPNALGGCGFQRGTGWLLARGYVESDMFIGTAALVLCVVAVTGRLRPGVPNGPRVYAVLLAAFVGNQMLLHDALQRRVATLPVFATSPPGRLRAVFAISFALLAAMGVDRIVSRSWQPRWWRRWQTGVVALVWAASAGGALVLAKYARRVDLFHHADALTRGIKDALAVAAVTAIVILVAALVPRAGGVVVLSVALIVAVQGSAYARGFWPRDPNASYYPTTPTSAFLAENLGTYRVTGDRGALRPGTATFYETASPVGHSFIAPNWNQLLIGVFPRADVTATFSALALDDSSIRSPILDQMSVKYVVNADDDALLGTAQAPPAPTGSTALSSTTSTSGPVGSVPLRGVGVTLSSPLSVQNAPYAAMHVDVLDGAGQVVAAGTRRIYSALPAGAQYVVAVTDQGSAPGPYTARVRLVGDPNATTVTTHDGQPALTATTKPDDGLRIVVSDGAVVYERASALPHVRWASAVRSVPADSQVAALAAGIPSDTVVLAPAAGATAGTAAAGGPAKLDVATDAGRSVAADVDATGAGYLVVSNSDIAGWTATVDGHPVAIVDADHGLQAVPVPTGTHRVVLTFHQAGIDAGIDVTLVALVVYAGLWAEVARRRLRSRRTASA